MNKEKFQKIKNYKVNFQNKILETSATVLQILVKLDENHVFIYYWFHVSDDLTFRVHDIRRLDTLNIPRQVLHQRYTHRATLYLTNYTIMYSR